MNGTDTEPETGSLPPLTMDAVNDLTDAVSGIFLAEDYGINIEGLDTLEEIQQRLKCHLRLKDGVDPKTKMVRKISRLGDKDGLKRDQLARMIKEIKNTFPDSNLRQTAKGQTLMEDLLLKDGTTDDIRKDCDTRIDSLKAKESVILVAGETSAGKSSVLNLLLGEEILPSHMLPCTSCITVIRYNPYRSAAILYRNGGITRIATLDKAGLEELQARAYYSQGGADDDVYQKRKEEHDIAEIQVFLPLDLLKSGLVLVDTPGIGENEFLENYLMDYIYSHQILGFLYVVMTDSALGLAEDRLVNLMSLIVKSQRNSSDVVKFDPKAAMFVCNRWDMVQEETRATVRASVLQQLSKCWPEFEHSMAVFFSTYKAFEETKVNPGYITDEYLTLLQGLYKLTDVSLDKRITASYKWLGTVLQRCVHYLKTMVTRIDMSDRARQKQTDATKEKLKILRSKSETVIMRLRQNVDDGIVNICNRVREYLQTPPAKMKLTKNWGKSLGELPDMEHAYVTWDWVKRRIDAAFDDRLTTLLDEWDKDEQYIPSLEKRLFRDAKLHLCDLESELNEIESNARDDDNISRTSRVSLLNNLCNSLDDYVIDDLMDVSVPEKMLHRVMRFVAEKGKRRQANQKLKAFMANPGLVAEKRSEKLLDQMVKGRDDSLEEFVREMMVRPFSYIRKLESKIPNMVRSNVMLLEKFEKEIVEQSKCRNEYLKFMEQIERVRGELIHYGEGHFFANDFTEHDIVLETTPKVVPESRVLVRKWSLCDLMRLSKSVAEIDDQKEPHGLWHTVYPGTVQREGREGERVSVKIYNCDMKIQNPAQEVSKLRCLLHTDVCVSEFLGMYQQKDLLSPAYIYAGNMCTMKQYLTRCVEADELKLLVEVLAGLQYIHSKGLVHMDLTKHSVTVDEKGNVKLTGACIPRRMGGTCSGPVLDFVYIAPEVLREAHVYISKSDMYSFALLALEVRDLEFVAFSEQRQMPLADFLMLHPQSIIEPHVQSSTFHHNVKKALLRCLDADLGNRPSAAEVSNEMLSAKRATSLIRKTAAPGHIWKTFTGKKR